MYLLLCIFSSVMAVLALSSWAAKQGNGFATDEVTGAIIGIGDYRRALVQAGVAAVIVDVVLNLGTGVVKTKRWLLDVIMVAAFAAAISGVNVFYIILTSGVIGVICAIAGRGKKAHAA